MVVSPADYTSLLEQLQKANAAGADAATWRRGLAWKAFQHCSTYDAAVAEWLWRQTGALAQVPVSPCQRCMPCRLWLHEQLAGLVALMVLHDQAWCIYLRMCSCMVTGAAVCL